MSDPTDVVEPEPYDIVFEEDKLLLRSYPPGPAEDIGFGRTSGGAGQGRGLPVLFIPPLMIQPLVYDLREGHTFVGMLRAAGFHPYIVDFGSPDADDSTVNIDTYVLDWLPKVIDAMAEHSGRSEYAMVGYCMGGLFALMVTAAHAGDRTPPVGIVTVGSPIDSAKMGALSFLSRIAHGQVDTLASMMGNVPGKVSSSAFKLMTPLRSITKKADLFMNMWDDEWVRGHESIEAWVGGFLDYPQEAFRQFLKEFMKENRLRDGTMEFGGHSADLKDITCPVLAFAGTNDKIVPVQAARAALTCLGSADVRFREVPGGHMGVVAGLRSPKNVWEPTKAFLAELAS
ncbi:MAG: alpha/beta fold hydrolase [Proteobacteria bacterium]|nr:alpha/beta fold hydrolase [Pseudomonadota bacterium]